MRVKRLQCFDDPLHVLFAASVAAVEVTRKVVGAVRHGSQPPDHYEVYLCFVKCFEKLIGGKHRFLQGKGGYEVLRR